MSVSNRNQRSDERRAVVERALSARIHQISLPHALALYGSEDELVSRMVESLPDLLIKAPLLGACYSTDALARWRHVTRQAVVAQYNKGRIFGLLHKGKLVYPSAQFDAQARMRPAFAALLAAIQDAGVEPLHFAIWLQQPNGSVSGLTPARAVQLVPIVGPLRPLRRDMTVIQPPASRPSLD